MAVSVRRLSRPFRIVSDGINKLPFAGKVSLQPLIREIFSATPEKRNNSIFHFLLLLALFFFGHGSQAWMGWQVFSSTASDLIRFLGAIYCLINCLVVYTHIVILIRVVILLRRNNSHQLGKIAFKPYSVGYTFFCLLFTLLGQFAFIFVYMLT